MGLEVVSLSVTEKSATLKSAAFGLLPAAISPLTVANSPVPNPETLMTTDSYVSRQRAGRRRVICRDQRIDCSAAGRDHAVIGFLGIRLRS